MLVALITRAFAKIGASKIIRDKDKKKIRKR